MRLRVRFVYLSSRMFAFRSQLARIRLTTHRQAGTRLPPWFREQGVLFRPTLHSARFVAIRSIPHLMRGYGGKKFAVDVRRAVPRGVVQGPGEGVQRLQRAFEADLPRLALMNEGSLSQDGAEEVVSQEMTPKFLMKHFGCLAA